MYYASIGILALFILLIENRDILIKRDKVFDKPFWVIYRRFLIAIIIYLVTDVLWGFLESLKIPALLFADTSFYFFSMAIGVFFWSQFVVVFLNEKNGFEAFLVHSGRIIALIVAVLSVVNIFFPLLFSIDPDGIYHALTFRYVILLAQIILLVLISIHTLESSFRLRKEVEKSKKYSIIAHFGLIMAFFMILQALFPYLPMYAVAYLLGTCLLRALVIRNEREEFRQKLDEAREISILKQSITTLLDNMPALSFSKDATTGVYLACNQAFAEYAHKENPDGVIGLTDEQIFDPETAKAFVEDDRMALSMDEPYIFYEDVKDAAGNGRQFQTTKLKFTDPDGRLCLLGMCEDVTDLVRIQRENATTKEAYEKARTSGIIFTHIAQTLAHGYEDLYYINLETEEFIEYHTDNETGALSEVRRGKEFFASCIRDAEGYVYPDDKERVLRAISHDNLISALEKNNVFMMTYRLLSDGEPFYVSMKVSRMEDDDRFIILGVADVDEDVKARLAAEQAKEERTAYMRLNALSGDFIAVYVVDPETDTYHEFSATDEYKSFDLSKEGTEFFEASREQIGKVIYSEDLERFMTYFTRENVLSEVEESGIFVMSYRLMINGKPTHVCLKASMIEEMEGKQLIVGINDVDSHVRREEDYTRRLAQAQVKASIDALTGVKNKHAYLDEEERLDRLIEEHREPEFAIVILDVNNLKTINDTKGHQAGDDYIRGACKIICDTFKKSPVFRVGGDEFAVVTEGDDYTSIDTLVGKINDHNAKASCSGGIVIACGFAKYDSDDCVATVFERADTAMYENKAILKEGKEETDKKESSVL